MKKANVSEIAFMQDLKHKSVWVVREKRFHPKRMWRFDFALPELKIAIEVEGGVWTGGRHTRGSGFVKDMEKYNEAAVLGWLVLRVEPKHLNSEKFNKILWRAILMRQRENDKAKEEDL